MACGCGGTGGPGIYEVTYPSGATKQFTTEIDAKVEAAKNGGTWRKVG